VTNRRDGLTEELEAMAAIGRALNRIADPGVRQRVLHWAVERFQAAEAPGVSPSARVPYADPALAVDSIGDMFADDRKERQQGLELVTPSDRPVESMLRSFVADFQRLAADWHGV
jgi:hypothetical protein